MPHTVYTNATEHFLSVDGYQAGMNCPSKCGGRLYQPEKLGVIIRVKGQQFASVHRYTVQKLRCGLCGELLSAPIPSDIGTEKYDFRFKALLAMQKYYVAVPNTRQEAFLSLTDFPLPHTTQWRIIDSLAGCVIPAYNALEVAAANLDLFHNDDTGVKITDVIKKNKEITDKKSRTGMFTTGILAKDKALCIALFYNGTQHAGENLSALLNKRTREDGEIIQMCDALSRNKPKPHKTTLCYCLSHAHRKFEELVSFYPEPCQKVMKVISKVYAFDKQTKEMTSQARLIHHKHHSKPLMDELHSHLQHLVDEKLVEPNDPLGEAINYTLKHWFELTQFLRVENAPLGRVGNWRGAQIPRLSSIESVSSPRSSNRTCATNASGFRIKSRFRSRHVSHNCSNLIEAEFVI